MNDRSVVMDRYTILLEISLPVQNNWKNEEAPKLKFRQGLFREAEMKISFR